MMLSLLIQKAFNNAASTWPSLKWPLESFQKHVAVDTTPKTAHLEDLYLAGSAGYREDSAWVVIEEEFGPKVQRVMEKKPKADLSVDDIWSQARLQMLEADKNMAPLVCGRYPAKIVKFRGLVALLSYLITVSTRVAIHRNKKRKPETILENEDTGKISISMQDLTSNTPDEIAESVESSKALFDALKKKYDLLTNEQRLLVTLVYRQGMKQKSVGKMLGWSETKASRQLKKAIESLREALVDTQCDELVLAGWSTLMSDCWDK